MSSESSDSDSELQKSVSNISDGNATMSKRAKLDSGILQLDYNNKLMDDQVVQQMSRAWQENMDYSDGNDLRISASPFCHTEINEFITSKNFMDSFCKTVCSDVKFTEKRSDLLQFKQSDNLKLTTLPEVKAIRNFLETKCLDLLRKITNFPLDGRVDMFLSEYQHTDFLLCHDDELESRRIAFILYLSPDWKSEYGGSLDLYESTEDICPTLVTRSISPAFNKFVFFTVTSRSFHQVSEVTESGRRRLALSGWFLGEAIPRPKIRLPQVVSYPPSVNLLQGVLAEYVMESYTKTENFQVINEQLVEDSQVLLMDFLKPSIFAKICDSLYQLEWDIIAGPANIHRVHYSKIKLWPNDDNGEFQEVNRLAAFFHSQEFFLLMEQMTEFQFHKADSITSSLQKYDQKCYTLLKSDNDETINAEHENRLASNYDNDEFSDYEDDETLVDLIYYGGDFEWADEWGGLTIYVDGEGKELITVAPRRNSLAIIVRNKSVNSYINYVNSLSQGCYFTYTMTLTFKKGC